jgi:hypothetical protein
MLGAAFCSGLEPMADVIAADACHSMLNCFPSRSPLQIRSSLQTSTHVQRGLGVAMVLRAANLPGPGQST